MPLNPFGLGKDLIQRIRDRIKQEFGGGQPAEPQDPDAEQPALKPALDDPNRGRDPMLIGPMTGAPQLMYRIRYGGRTRTLLWMKYNGTWRHVEPYSFRYRSRGMQPLFYGYCQLHDEIHSFRLDRVQDLHVTDRPFAPRWSVEIA